MTDDEKPKSSVIRRLPRLGCAQTVLLCVAISLGALLFVSIITTLYIGQPDLRVSREQTEIKSLEAGLADFNSVFGRFPPSRINFYEQAGGWDSDERSRELIAQMWPDFNFSLDRDINADGNNTGVLRLTGAECLVFFLGAN